MSRTARIATAAGVIVAALCIGLGPFALMALPNPEPLAVSAPGVRGYGTYVQGSRGTFQLYPKGAQTEEFPRDAFAIDASVSVFVRAKQYVGLTAYSLYVFPSGRPVETERVMVKGRMLRLRPVRPLPAGRYILTTDRGDAWGGSDYFYLTVH